jgi:hypothetical protein
MSDGMKMPVQTDPTLRAISEGTRAAVASTRALYEVIRAAKANGYSYRELEGVTGFPRGTVQNIVDGRNPRLTVE